MSLDYGFTCPDIDRNIDSAKEVLYDFMLETYKELNPIIEDIPDSDLPPSIKERAKKDSDYLYGTLEDIFENVRSVNEDMRNSADKQISDLNDRVSDLEAEVESLRGEIL